MNKSVAELEAIQREVTEEKSRLAPLNLKRIPEIVDEALGDMAEDLDEMRAKIEEINDPKQE